MVQDVEESNERQDPEVAHGVFAGPGVGRGGLYRARGEVLEPGCFGRICSLVVRNRCAPMDARMGAAATRAACSACAGRYGCPAAVFDESGGLSPQSGSTHSRHAGCRPMCTALQRVYPRLLAEMRFAGAAEDAGCVEAHGVCRKISSHQPARRQDRRPFRCSGLDKGGPCKTGPLRNLGHRCVLPRAMLRVSARRKAVGGALVSTRENLALVHGPPHIQHHCLRFRQMGFWGNYPDTGGQSPCQDIVSSMYASGSGICE